MKIKKNCEECKFLINKKVSVGPEKKYFYAECEIQNKKLINEEIKREKFCKHKGSKKAYALAKEIRDWVT